MLARTPSPRREPQPRRYGGLTAVIFVLLSGLFAWRSERLLRGSRRWGHWSRSLSDRASY